MPNDPEVYLFLIQHLGSIFENDIETYHATTSEDLTLYEWFITPHRIDGLPFHDFMMSESEHRGIIFGDKNTKDTTTKETTMRFDLANLHIQRYSDTAIASYTLLISIGTEDGIKVTSHNESRVMVKLNDHWKVVHVHKSPSWNVPLMPPGYQEH